ncbi:MAG: glutathione S-transferase C-terminal domain-containing protein, partial [Gammaproteobacteria bacterium]|nr:glutathione S-transferase C-terminal domain-containing protein [Gammaproteobacteria bacterium]
QMAGVGPMFGQAGHFTLYAKEQVPYGIERYSNEAKRILGVMDAQLGRHSYLAGGHYGIADIATFPWTASALRIPTIGSLDPWPNVVRWRTELGERPAVQRGLAQPKRD